MKRFARLLAMGACAAALLCAQDEPPAPAPTQAPAGGGGGRGGFGGNAGAVPDPQPYDRVITKDAKTTKGLFTVHQIKERYYYEIPKNELGKELLWNSQIAKTTLGAGYGGGQYAEQSGPLGTEGQSRAAAGRQLTAWRRGPTIRLRWR